MPLPFENKIILVTGSGRGIGRAIALHFARLGADLVINFFRNRRPAEKTASEIRTLGRRAIVVRANIGSLEGIQDLFAEIEHQYKGLDILVCNAGINWDGVIWKMTEEQWDTVLDINLKGYFNYTRAVSPLMREQNLGRIVNITSINGLRGKFGQTNYSAANAGIIGFTKALAKELGKNQITVNAVAPGMILTAMMKDLPQNIIDAAVEETVVKRLGAPEDVAFVVTFLCTDMAKHITGEVIKVDGGQYI